MKFAVLGGSFDPVHIGHIKLARAALAAGYDRIIFVPVFRSPFKGTQQEDSAQKRLLMLLAAISARREFTLDPCEIRREGISYTIDTLRDIASRYPCTGKPGLLLGDDLAADFPQWKDAAEIASLADIVIARREQAKINFPFRHLTLENDIFELSSAQIRALIAAGGAWEELVPEGAREIIAETGLYRREEGEGRRENGRGKREEGEGSGGGSPPRSEACGFSATPPAGADPRNAPCFVPHYRTEAMAETAQGGPATSPLRTALSNRSDGKSRPWRPRNAPLLESPTSYRGPDEVPQAPTAPTAFCPESPFSYQRPWSKPPRAVAHLIPKAGQKAPVAPQGGPLLESLGWGMFLRTIEDAVRGSLNVRRFLHSRNVALHCADLAGRFGLDADRAYLAGITHDVCKELSDDEMVALAGKDGQPFSELETNKPSLLHGRAAAIFLKEHFSINDPAVLEAVRFHTTGAAGMGPLAKIVYLTDKIEVGRRTVDQKLRELAFGPNALQNLDELFLIIHKATIEFLEARGLTAVNW